MHKLIFSIIIIALIAAIRHVIIIRVRGDVAFLSEDQRNWISRTRNGSIFAILFILFALWQYEINEFALSLTAIAVAVVVASKEIILCFTGSIQRASSRSYRIGDWIEVGDLIGEVIEHNMIVTRIQEIDLVHGEYHYTGKTVTFPNSVFFTHAVKNLYFMKRYVYHRFFIATDKFVDVFPLLDDLYKNIEEHCADFIEVAKRYNGIIEKRAGVDLPGHEPSITVTNTTSGEQLINFTIFCPTERAKNIEQLIRKDFMKSYRQYMKSY